MTSCPTGKRGYPDELAAQRALESTIAARRTRTGRRRRHERRAYPCPECGAWHLTSRKQAAA